MVKCPEKRRLAIIALDVFMVFYSFFLTNFTKWMSQVLPPCFFYERGFICPSCGGTRCVNEFGKGNFAKAFSYNPYLFCVGVYLIILAVFLNLGYLFNLGFARKTVRFMTDYRVIIAIVAGYAIFGILRNII